MTLDEVEQATTQDDTLTCVKEHLRTGKWDKTCPDVRRSGNILLYGTRIVIPRGLQKRAVELGHVEHQGQQKTKALLHEKDLVSRHEQDG